MLYVFFLVNYISSSKKDVVEGRLRCKELSEYLEKVHAPKVVWLSEDGSGIVSKVCYDSTTNQMVGLVLPTDQKTGMPIPFSFMPKSVTEIEQQLQQPKSTLVYVVMAQPIKENIPPFVLQIYGVNNTFTAETVMKRWEFTQKELAK